MARTGGSRRFRAVASAAAQVWGRRTAPPPAPAAPDARIAAYDARRPTPHRAALCNAPLTNLYLKADGRTAPCWLKFEGEAVRWGPDRSILDIWASPEMEALRRAHAAREFPGRCQECRHDIEAGVRPLAAAYDNDRPIGDGPSMLEVELSNRCNLECVMCDGELSSLIRRNREQRPPLDVPYDERLVADVAAVLPGLQELRINGGEPLLQPLVFALLDEVARLRPDLPVTIATNGTVLNDRVRRAMEGCALHFNVSIDSLRPERYAEIRVHSDLARVLRHLEELQDYCRRHDRRLSIMVNPMRVNWDEMPEMLHWCEQRDLFLWFNTIRHPEHLALHSLPVEELERVHAHLAGAALPGRSGARPEVHRNNAAAYRGLVAQVAAWLDEARAGLGTPVTLGSRPEAG